MVADVLRCLRREVPELWSNQDLVRMTSENVAEHVVGVLAGLEHGIDPGEIDPPAAELERARRLARYGTPVTALLRAFRLGQGVVLERLLAEMPRLTKDAELVSAASRLLIAMANGYVDDASEQGVTAFQEERDRRMQWRQSLVNEAGLRIGTTLDIARTTQELADLALDHFADLVTVDLLDSAVHGHGTPAPGPLVLHGLAQASTAQGGQEPTIRVRERHTCPDGSVTARALTTVMDRVLSCPWSTTVRRWDLQLRRPHLGDGISSDRCAPQQVASRCSVVQRSAKSPQVAVRTAAAMTVAFRPRVSARMFATKAPAA
ncbi:hypothetical protein [Streptomyces sp. NPDC008137]|uniref:hypothetical protein n=1 Tax=Streptomyces sp. NPDC008137 TaxID=3364813 RepID=UPI0036E7A9D3